jgi:hypothetical protein
VAARVVVRTHADSMFANYSFRTKQLLAWHLKHGHADNFCEYIFVVLRDFFCRAARSIFVIFSPSISGTFHMIGL